ncbi:MAG: DNA/RNA nuclease SfsA [Halioglobus sp.]
MEYSNLIEATLLKRYKRFLADVELADGSTLTVHCPNTGAMTGCAEPGSRVWLSTSTSTTRKYPNTWELVESSSGTACIHSALANKLAREALEAGLIPELSDFQTLTPEVKLSDKTRLDFRLDYPEHTVFIEVKSVTLASQNGQGLFPDAVSERGRKHLNVLAQLTQQPKTRAVLLFCVLHTGIERVSTAADIDPQYREAMQEALAAGVEVLAWRADISPQKIRLTQSLPFSLDPLV